MQFEESLKKEVYEAINNAINSVSVINCVYYYNIEVLTRHQLRMVEYYMDCAKTDDFDSSPRGIYAIAMEYLNGK